ncbi:MAG: hypothetical protein ABI579_08855 [Candidatus Sumerlaeota bacterium]
MMKRRVMRLMLATLLAAGTFSFVPMRVCAQQDFLNSFVNPGEKMSLRSERLPDGTVGTLNTVAGENGGFQRFEGEGIIVLESPRLNLRCHKLLYDGTTGVLTASGEVDLKKEGVAATCEDFFYNTSSKQIVMKGKPVVHQATDKNNALFQGMQEFTMHQMDDGSSEIQMSGGDEIDCQVVPLGQEPISRDAAGAKPTPTPVPTPSPVPQASAEPVAADSGFAGLGNNVSITTKEKDAKNPPNVFVTTDPAGAFSTLRAYGFVEVISETMNLRSESLEYDKEKDLLEALYNVYIRQQEIEATAGRMLYILTSQKITLTINPEVKQTKPDGILNITQMDSFIMVKNADGTTTTQAIGGPDGAPKYEYQAAVVKPDVTPKPTGGVELDPNDPTAVDQIGRIEKPKGTKNTSGGQKPPATR